MHKNSMKHNFLQGYSLWSGFPVSLLRLSQHIDEFRVSRFIISWSFKLACSSLSVSGDDRKSVRGTSGIWPGKKKNGECVPSPIFFYHIPLVSCPLFRSFPLTESLEQASFRCKKFRPDNWPDSVQKFRAFSYSSGPSFSTKWNVLIRPGY